MVFCIRLQLSAPQLHAQTDVFVILFLQLGEFSNPFTHAYVYPYKNLFSKYPFFYLRLRSSPPVFLIHPTSTRLHLATMHEDRYTN